MSELLTAKDDAVFADLCACDDILILIHRNPDGDAIGTGMALKTYLSEQGKNVCVACDGDVPKRLSFLTNGQNTFVPSFEPKTIVAVDTATTEMLGDSLQSYADKVQYCIDHHHTNSRYALNNIVVGTASSAGEVLGMLLARAGKLDTIGQKTAQYLYAAIASDSGCFKYANTSPTTHRMVADLTEKYDIPFALINRLLFDVSDEKHIRLEGLVSGRIQSFFDGYLALCAVPLSLLEQCGVEENDCDGLVGIPRRLETAQVSVLLRERSDGSVRLSLRSETDDVDVSAVAAKFGGGGHKRASGCTIVASLDEAVKTIVKAFGEAMGRNV